MILGIMLASARSYTSPSAPPPFRFPLLNDLTSQHLVYDDPPLTGFSFSIVLPFFPPQVVEMRTSVSQLRTFLHVDDMDKMVLVSPCSDRVWTVAAAMCSEPEANDPVLVDQESWTREWGPKNRSMLTALIANGGRIDLLEAWRQGPCKSELLDFLPTDKIMHVCDDAIICGRVRGCFDEAARKRGRFMSGWYIQQLVKLGVSRWVSSPHMLILDADAYALNYVSTLTLISQSGASRILSARHIQHGALITSESVGGRWYKRYGHALDILKEHRNHTVKANAAVLGVTPQTLSTAVVRRLLDTLEARHRLPWWQVLGYTRFTEFTLYNTFLLLNWDEFGSALHDDSADIKQLAVWSHDLDDIRPEGHGAMVDHAYLKLTTKLRAIRFRATFLVCQDETGLTATDCLSLARRCHDDIVAQCKSAAVAQQGEQNATSTDTSTVARGGEFWCNAT